MKTKSDSSFIPHPSSLPMRPYALRPTLHALRPMRPYALRPMPNALRRGVTLVEMLVVLVIISMLAAVALQALPSGDQRYREAARMLNVYLNSARAAAMENGRPVGVILKRFTPNYNVACTLISQCETPPPYAGETLGATVSVTSPAAGQILVAGTFSTDMVKAGDRIRLNGQGPLYVISNSPAPTATSITADIEDTHLLTAGWQMPWDATAKTASFVIYRQPITNGGAVFTSSAEPLQLPAGVAIDLALSGYSAGTAWTQFDNVAHLSHDILVTFSPSGEIKSIGYSDGTTLPIAPPLVCLLVGKLGRIPAGSAEDGLDNEHDLTNYWVTIQPQSGMINTAEMSAGADPRAYAKESQTSGR